MNEASVIERILGHVRLPTEVPTPHPGLFRADGEFSVQRHDHLRGVTHEYAKAAA